MLNCERCHEEHDGSFATGRFCSKACANARDHSETTKLKTSKSMAGKRKQLFDKTCPHCQKVFRVTPAGLSRRFCSVECKWAHPIDDSLRKRFSDAKKREYANGRVVGGYTKRIEVSTSNGTFVVQGSFEVRACIILDKLLDEKIIKSWSYNKERFAYVFDDKIRTYLPDFVVQFPDVRIFVEVKGFVRANDPAKWKSLRDQGHKLEVWKDSILQAYEQHILLV